MAQFEFSEDEMSDLIYAAREASIRYKRARTFYREGHEDYSHWDEETLSDKISHYKGIEVNLRRLYGLAFGVLW